MSFKGIYYHSLDDKNRLIIPAKFRNELGEYFVVTKGLDGCLSVYTTDRWDQMIDRLSEIPSTKKDARAYLRILTSNAIDCSLDNQGRIQLSQHLVATADIKKKCVILGVAERLEIWPEEVWEKFNEEASQVYEELAESITEDLQ